MTEATNTNKTTKTDIYNIDPRRIVVVAGFNSRTDFGNIDELAAQIKEQGLLNPITVKPVKDDNGVETYQLVDGERRYRAVMQLINAGVDIARIKALYVSKSATEAELLTQQFMRNEGKNFSEYELGILCKKLRDNCGKTIPEIAKMLGKNQGVISYALGDLEYDERIQDMMRKGQICGPDVRRVFTAARERYGKEEGELKAIQELLSQKAKSEKAPADGNKPAKVSVKDSQLYVDSKNTKAFIKGMKMLKSYMKEFHGAASGLDIDFDIFEMYRIMEKDKSVTLRSYFESLIEKAKSAQKDGKETA